MQTCAIIIPCYNESTRLNFDLIDKYLSEHDDGVLVFVNDGSTDDTSELLDEFKSRDPARIYIIDLKVNSGKAQAIRSGMLFALDKIKPAYIGYFDADLSTPFSEIDRMFTLLDRNEKTKVIFGSRVKRMGSIIERSLIRHYAGRIFATLVSMLLGLPVYDSQCGAKVMTAERASALFKDAFLTTWLFDVELLFRYKNHFGTDKALLEIYEYPLYEWKAKKGSRIRIFHLLFIPIDLIKIYRHYKSAKN
ncbi:MAG: glycosyltransferase [Bacteroidales bacterium]|nr:glycosyltransferase [Bacteroidales bacterium]